MDKYRAGKQRPKVRLHRGIDGRLRSSSVESAESDIGDLWAAQKRIRLAEAIEEDKKRAARQQIRHEEGLVGLVSKQVGGSYSKLKIELFGERTVKRATGTNQHTPGKPKKPDRKSGSFDSAAPKRQPVVLNLKAAADKLPKIPKKFMMIGGISAAAIVIVSAGAISFVTISHHRKQQALASQANSSHGVNSGQNLQVNSGGGTGGVLRDNPKYQTLLPAGKSIQSLGGWYKTNTTRTGDTHIYSDSINGVKIIVSEQPLPQSYLADPAQKLAVLANSYRAGYKVVSGGTTLYFGTANDKSQYVIFQKSNLLFIVTSSGKIPYAGWEAYIASLQPSS